jgi:RimJ/RimL family protein N-acetyltransferase
MELRTARAVIRPWRTDEADRLLDIVRRREVTQWLGSPEPWSGDDVDEFIAGNSGGTQIPVRRAIVPLATGVPVGTIMIERFKPLLGEPGDPHLGWFLHPDAQGQGWATEAAAALLRFAVTGGAPRVWAGMWPHNTGSANVARRIGLVDLGRQEDPWYGTVEYPLSRLFCVWRPDAEHPLGVLARLNAAAVREPATAPPPVGRDGATYPGPV